MKVIIINGAPRTGKDTFIEYLNEINNGKVGAYSSIDWVKSMAGPLGWDGKKDTKGREFLSEIKDACSKYADIPFKKIIEKILMMQGMRDISPELEIDYFCTNIREPSEIEKLEDWCKEQGIPCYSIWIRRKEAEEAAKAINNTGDSQYMNHAYSYMVRNDGTLEAFKTKIKALIRIIERREEVVA